MRSPYVVALALASVVACAHPHAQDAKLSSPKNTTHGPEHPRFTPKITTDLMSRSILFTEPERTAPRISPDGTRLGFGATVNGVSTLWVGPADDVAQAKPLRIKTAGQIHSWFFAYAPEQVLYVIETQGREDWRPYAIDVRGDRAVDLTPEGRVGADILRMSHRRPYEIAIGAKAPGAEVVDVFVVDIRTGVSKRVFENKERFIDFDLDDDLVPRVATRITDAGEREVRKIEPNGTSSLLFRVGVEDQLTTATISLDEAGTTIFLQDSRGRDKVAVTAFDIASGKTTVIAENDDADIDGVLTNPHTRRPEAVASDPGRRTWRALDDQIKGDLAAIGDAQHDTEVVSRTLDDTKWIVREHAPDAANAWSIYDRVAKKKTPLFVDRPALATLDLVPMSVINLRARDGLPLVGYLSVPPVTAASVAAEAPKPMVLFVHGGPWDRDRWELSAMHQLLVSRGYVVLSVNFRGSTGFGKKHLNAGNREWGGKMQDDLLDTVAWAVEKKIADPTRVAIVGGSYGGYATLFALSHNQNKTFACGVDLAGPSNLLTFVEAIPPSWRPYLGQFRARIGDKSTDAGRRDLLMRSPLTSAAAIDRPLLIVQGKNDPRVKEVESARIAAAVDKTGTAVTYLLYDDEGHGLSQNENWISFAAVLEVFLSQCIGGAAEPFGTALHGSSMRAIVGGEHIAGLAKAAFEP